MTAYPAVRVLLLSCALFAVAGCGGETSSTDAGARPDTFAGATDAPVTPGADPLLPPADDAATPPLDAPLGPSTVSFMADVQPILSASCMSSRCHSNPSTFFLGGGTTACAMATDRRMVVPGDSAASYVVHKLEGTSPCGVRMPRGRTPLSAAQMTTIRTWIDEGARNN